MTNLRERKTDKGKRSRYEFRPAAEGEMAAVSLRFRDGGQNAFSYANEKRGIEIGVRMVTLERSTSGYMTESFDVMSDRAVRALVLELPRYSAGRMASVAAVIDPLVPELAAKWQADQQAGMAVLKEILAKVA